MSRQTKPVQSLVRACNVLKAFRDESECLRLAELVERTELNKATAFRILTTLVQCDLVARVGASQYKLKIRPVSQTRYRIGYATQSGEFAFCRAVTRSLQRSAAGAGLDLLLVDNRDSPQTALRNTDLFIRERVHLVIESQTDTRIADQLSDKLRKAKIPMLAIEIPHPNAVYFGANNTQAGLIAGRHLARWAELTWEGRIDELLLLELPKAGQLPNARILGSLLGVLERFAGLSKRQIKVLKTSGYKDSTHEKVRQYLKRSKSERILVSAINDPCALGALQAFRDAGREQHCAIVGQNASEDVYGELRTRDTRLIGSVGYFPERYGEGVIPLVLNILEGKRVPPATFVKHQMVTPGNLASLYPEI